MNIDEEDLSLYQENVQSTNPISQWSSHESRSKTNSSSVSPERNLSFHEKKWHRLQENYNDQYLELFRETVEEHHDDDEQASDLIHTRLGTVDWSSGEKDRLFRALSTTSIYDIDKISERVGTKSEIEVKHYLDWLHKENADQQRFGQQREELKLAEIPAAAEISAECETALEKAADALAAFQEHYDNAAGPDSRGIPWLIDHETAVKIDLESNQHEADETVTLDNEDRSAQDAAQSMRLFHLSTFLELSKDLYMNRRTDDFLQHWKQLAEEGQTPEMTSEVVLQFYDMVLNLTRRLVQTTIFLAKSRIRASSYEGYQAANVLREQDVNAAVSVLNLNRDLWDYWTYLGRRNNLRVIAPAGKKGSGRPYTRTYDEIETILSVRGQNRRRRSSSVVSRSSLSFSASSGKEAEIEAPGPAQDTIPPPGVEALSEPEETDSELDLHIDNVAVIEPDDMEDTEESNQGGGIELNPEWSSESEHNITEDVEAEYLDQIDQKAQEAEEISLWQILGVEKHAKLVKDKLASHIAQPPRSDRQFQGVALHSVQFQAEWETMDE